MASEINTTVKRASLLWMTAQDPASVWTPPTGDWTVKLFDESDVELSGAGYGPIALAGSAMWEVNTTGGWHVRNGQDYNAPAAASATWSAIRYEKWYVDGDTVPAFVFDFDPSPVVVASGETYFVAVGDRVLRPG